MEGVLPSMLCLYNKFYSRMPGLSPACIVEAAAVKFPPRRLGSPSFARPDTLWCSQPFRFRGRCPRCGNAILVAADVEVLALHHIIMVTPPADAPISTSAGQTRDSTFDAA